MQILKLEVQSIFLSPGWALQSSHHHYSLCSNDVTHSLASSLAKTNTLSIFWHIQYNFQLLLHYKKKLNISC